MQKESRTLRTGTLGSLRSSIAWPYMARLLPSWILNLQGGMNYTPWKLYNMEVENPMKTPWTNGKLIFLSGPCHAMHVASREAEDIEGNRAEASSLKPPKFIAQPLSQPLAHSSFSTVRSPAHASEPQRRALHTS